MTDQKKEIPTFESKFSQMTIHKEGIPSILLVFAVSAILIFTAKFLAPDIVWVHYIAYAASGFLIITILQFFRMPNRSWTINDEKIVSPCDGKVVVIEEVEETEYFNEKRLQISIFMSPVNVHCNRNPISGIFKYVKYHDGKFLMAFNPKSSTENERSTVVIEHKNGKAILMRQVAGFLARRIVYYCKEGEQANQIDQFGFIKFGSRVDLFLPLGTKLDVKIGDSVKGGVSTIGDL